jgi:hypothetical protein
MRKIKEVLRIHLLGGVTSYRRIGRAVGCGKTAVSECLRRAAAAGLNRREEVVALDEQALERRLYPGGVKPPIRPQSETMGSRGNNGVKEETMGSTLYLIVIQQPPHRPLRPGAFPAA